MKTNINLLNYDSLPTILFATTHKSNDNKDDNKNLNFAVNKIIDDFKWVFNALSRTQSSYNTLSRRNFLTDEVTLSPPIKSHGKILQSTASLYLTQWLKENLNEYNLCGFIQYLVNDKELLEEHYKEEALLRQEKYVTVLIIGLTAFETKQYDLLRQIDGILKSYKREEKRLKRSISQPIVIEIPKTKSNISYIEQSKSNTSAPQNRSALISTTIRKTKSLPEYIDNNLNIEETPEEPSSKRPRCKTINIFNHKIIGAQNIPQKLLQSLTSNMEQNEVPISSLDSSLYDYDDNQPTTSQESSNMSKSPLSNYTLNSNKSTTSSLMSTSVSSFNCYNNFKGIQLINTDDIKIWTDHSWELKQKSKEQKQSQSCDIPPPLAAPIAKPSKSVSPLNSFFSSLFNTPPSYTSWYTEHDIQIENESPENAVESIRPDNVHFQNHQSVISLQQQSSSVSISSTVFDKFLPIDGKKVRCRKSQNLFDDVNTALDCTGINKLVPTSNLCNESHSSILLDGSTSSSTSKNCQSLTKFLQMSPLSRNNTDLEKENAHFRISEAIISAIEHIKWNKLETQKDKSCCEATPLATDCLASSNGLHNSPIYTTSSDIIEGEHIPYVELEEVNYDLSAEVVGLSLISKFDEKHMPKVSELKWLVSDDDTPQKLLPMPDLTSSNPDEHVIHSATRGTRYWAPPRQQIIFTDHPPPNRKELLKKQNYRCAGCGMRVSPQYMQSFRYCTYLGKYHCTGCHRNQISSTPAKILQTWDFKCYPVSVFAYRLLEQMYAYPLFYVPDLNPALYIRCKTLRSARYKRLQLKYVKDFICMCRFALREKSYFESIPDYITADIDNWSMSDFIDARTKCLHRSIDELICNCESHIFNCVLCTARGFLCEYCHVDVVIYPWDLRVERCDRCGTCFHRSCWKSMSGKCCRCQRIDKRQDVNDDVI